MIPAHPVSARSSAARLVVEIHTYEVVTHRVYHRVNRRIEMQELTRDSRSNTRRTQFCEKTTRCDAIYTTTTNTIAVRRATPRGRHVAVAHDGDVEDIHGEGYVRPLRSTRVALRACPRMQSDELGAAGLRGEEVIAQQPSVVVSKARGPPARPITCIHSLIRSFIRDCLIIEYPVHIHTFNRSFIRDCLIIEYPLHIHTFTFTFTFTHSCLRFET